MKHLDVLWKAVKNINKKLDSIEDKVAHAIEPFTPESRETPFFFTEKFVFDLRNLSFEPREQTIVSSAGVVTRVTRLNYTVYFRTAIDTSSFVPVPPMLPLQNPFVREEAARQCAQGLRAGDDNAAGSTQESIGLFDFEWNFSIGSTERTYAKIYGDTMRGFCSRETLGNFDQNDSLVLDDDHPLILGSNEFLIFKVRPTLNNFFLPPFDPQAPFPIISYEAVVCINAVGFRSLSNV